MRPTASSRKKRTLTPEVSRSGTAGARGAPRAGGRAADLAAVMRRRQWPSRPGSGRRPEQVTHGHRPPSICALERGAMEIRPPAGWSGLGVEVADLAALMVSHGLEPGGVGVGIARGRGHALHRIVRLTG